MKTENTQETFSFEKDSLGCNALKNTKVFNEQWVTLTKSFA